MSDKEKTLAKTWQQQEKESQQKLEALLGENTSIKQTKIIDQITSDAEELQGLMDWFTDEWDKLVNGLQGTIKTDSEVQSYARSTVKKNHPEKYNRLRELESKQNVRNATHQQLATAAHASVVEANLRYSSLWKA